LAEGNATYMYRDFGREPWIGDDAACKEILHEVILNKEEIL